MGLAVALSVGVEFLQGWLPSRDASKRDGSVAISVYDWWMAFLSSHSQYKGAVIEEDFYAPELMVASDLGTGEKIR